MTHARLELLLAEPRDGAAGPTLVLPATIPLERLAVGRLRLLPAPPAAAPVAQLRAWHHDALMGLGEDVRSSIAVAAGPTAAFLLPAFAPDANPVVLVREPLAGLGAAEPRRLPKKRSLAALEGKRAGPLQERLRPWANPQSRALLEPWHDTSELAVTLGPPDDASRWRELLFDDVLPQVEIHDDAALVARGLAGAFGVTRKRANRMANDLVNPPQSEPRKPVEATHAELLRSLNWLDAELYERCSVS